MQFARSRSREFAAVGGGLDMPTARERSLSDFETLSQMR
jgi:hypothetical protein